MYIIGENNKGGLRSTTIQIVDTNERLYYFLALWARNHIRMVYEYRPETINLEQITLRNIFEEYRFKYFIPSVYSLDINIYPISSNERTTVKISNRELMNIFIANNYPMDFVLNDLEEVPVNVLQERR